MIPSSELKKYAFVRGISNMGQVRLDYAQDLLLFLLYRESPNFVFKGGTCLWKLFKLPRFSEDLDLSFPEKTDPVDGLKKNLELLGFSVEVPKKKFTENTLFSKIVLSASDFSPTEVSIEIGFRKEDGEDREFYSPYPDISDFVVRTLPLQKICDDKVGAILGRDKPRDVFDLYYLVSRYGVSFEVPDRSRFEKKLEGASKAWKGLEDLVVRKLPEFAEVKRRLIGELE